MPLAEMPRECSGGHYYIIDDAYNSSVSELCNSRRLRARHDIRMGWMEHQIMLLREKQSYWAHEIEEISKALEAAPSKRSRAQFEREVKHYHKMKAKTDKLLSSKMKQYEKSSMKNAKLRAQEKRAKSNRLAIQYLRRTTEVPRGAI